LGELQIQGDTEVSGPWFWYIVGAKRLLTVVADPSKQDIGAELKSMLGWVHYYDVLAHFSLRHWHRVCDKPRFRVFREMLGPAQGEILLRVAHRTCSTDLLPLLTELFENVVQPSNPRYFDPQYRTYLADLEMRLTSLSTASNLEPSGKNCYIELYRLAALIYLERASNNFSGQSAKIDRWTQAALDFFDEKQALKHVFPLFIVGCEARSDEQRIIVLDALDRTIRRTRSRSMELLHTILQSAWNQDDLGGGANLDYITRMDAVLSSCPKVPSFA
jgi:hypothetical protein